MECEYEGMYGSSDWSCWFVDLSDQCWRCGVGSAAAANDLPLQERRPASNQQYVRDYKPEGQMLQSDYSYVGYSFDTTERNSTGSTARRSLKKLG